MQIFVYLFAVISTIIGLKTLRPFAIPSISKGKMKTHEMHKGEPVIWVLFVEYIYDFFGGFTPLYYD